MARLTKEGKHIISASEVGSYVVCPYAWYLSCVKKLNVPKSCSSHEGKKLHKQWRERYRTALYLHQGLKLVVTFLISAVVIFLIKKAL